MKVIGRSFHSAIRRRARSAERLGRTLFERGRLWFGAWLWCIAACARGGSVQAPASVHDTLARRLHGLAGEYVAAYQQMFPDQAEYNGKSLAHHDALPDNSLAALEAWQKREDAWSAELARIDSAKLWGTPEWALLGYLRSTLESSIGSRVCHAELWPAHQFGWQSGLLSLLDSQPLGTPIARAEALARWRQLPRFLDTEIENLRRGVQLGYSAPRRNVELAQLQLDALLRLSTEDSPFASISKRDADSGFQTTWRELVESRVRPAIRRYRDFCATNMLLGRV